MCVWLQCLNLNNLHCIALLNYTQHDNELTAHVDLPNKNLLGNKRIPLQILQNGGFKDYSALKDCPARAEIFWLCHH